MAVDRVKVTTPWIGVRVLHDGRTNDLLAAILAHGSSGSEASKVVGMFQSLSSAQQQDLLDFLRSL